MASILLSCESISKTYGVQAFFTNLSFALFEGDRVGVVGPNGAGKSTFLKILAGLEHPDEGTRTARRLLGIGYVPQDPVFPARHTVEHVLTQTLVEAGWDAHEHAGRIARALRLGAFPRSHEPVEALSGGWQKRLAIARAMMLEPDVLLMDEPTNHLDVEGILWLQALLNAEARACIVVSHDRRFLEAVTSRMLELNRRYPSGVFEAKGRYSDYLEQREALLQHQTETQASLANRVRREVEWLRRGPKARTTKAKARIQTAGKLIDELAQAESRLRDDRVEVDFVASGRKSKQLLVTRQIGKAFGDKPVVNGLDLSLGPGQRLGLLGPNGSGKTTILRLLAGTLRPDQGTISRAEGLRTVFFEQHRESLDQSTTLRRALAPSGDAVVYQHRSVHLVSWAKRFLFRPEQLDLPVARLSGGEQARLVIARLMLQPADLLLLDEPTNDLDIPTLDVLEDSLMEFSGAVVLVTHDRWLLERVSTSILALDGTGRTEWFADYAQWEAARRRSPEPKESLSKPRADERSRTDVADEPRRKPKLSYREQQEWTTIEERILSAEASVSASETALRDPGVASDAEALQARLAAVDRARSEVERLYARWAELEEKRTRVPGPTRTQTAQTEGSR